MAVKPKTLLSVLAGLLALLAAASTVSAAELRGMQLSATLDAAQLTLDLSGGVQAPRLFVLKAPDRAVIDLKETHPAEGLRLPVAAGAVRAIRMGRRLGGTLRVVLVLRSPLRLTSAWSDPVPGEGRQLIIAVGEPVARAFVGPHIVHALHAPTGSARDIIIAVDAGHGGVDPGAIGHGGTEEKDVTLAIARRLAARIDEDPGMRAVLTRDSDEFISLRGRMALARAAKADMFISIHANASPDRSASGCSVYVLSERGATSEAARWLAERENAADLIGGVRLDDKSSTLASVLLNLSQSASISESMTAARQVLASLGRVEEEHTTQVQQAGFVVLKSPDIPSMLIETAYISNPREERKLRSRREQQRLADAIYAGIRSYFEANPPDGTKLAAQRHDMPEGTGTS